MSEKRMLVSFDRAIKNILRDKANHDVLEGGFLSTLLEKDITILPSWKAKEISRTNQTSSTGGFGGRG